MVELFAQVPKAVRGEAVALRKLADAFRFAAPPFHRRPEERAPCEIEPRWCGLAAAFVDHEDLGGAARELLAAAPAAWRDAALAALPPPRPTSGPYRAAARSDFFARWSRGEHSAWDELAALGPLDGDLRAEAEALARAVMERVRNNAEKIASRLAAAGWPLDLSRTGPRPSPALRPELESPFPPRGPDPLRDPLERAIPTAPLDAVVSALESTTGLRIPVALVAFWRHVDRIDFTPGLDEPRPDWLTISDTSLDPLVVDDVETARWERIEDIVNVREASDPRLARPPEIWISPDRYSKVGVSGGGPYTVAFGPGTADARLLHAREKLDFVPYLRHALRWGGFPGLAISTRPRPKIDALLPGLTRDLTPF